MKRIGWLILLCLPTLVHASQSDVIGLWAGPTSIFEVAVVDGSLTGTVRALLNPHYLPEEGTGKYGQIRSDDNNPDPSFRNRPLVGLSMFSEYRYDAGQWQGKIYDPESGNTYQSRMSLNKKGELEVRGYVGLPMFGRTATFVPVARCTETIRLMLEKIPEQPACEAPETEQKD
jgi:uncharacterized protein (DUF2147 family)